MDKLIQSQKNALEKFITSSKQNITCDENLVSKLIHYNVLGVDETCKEWNPHNTENIESPLISSERNEENTIHMEIKEWQYEISSQ